MRLYIAGPMRGYPGNNTAAFEAATIRLRGLGFEVTSPHEITRDVFLGDDSLPSRVYLEVDICELLQCGGIAVLPGWERSTGARCEATIAVTLGLPFYDAETGEPIPTPQRIVVAGGYERPPGAVEDAA